MSYAACDGSFVPDELAAVLDSIAWRSTAYRGNYHDEQRRLYDAPEVRAGRREDAVVRALVAVADACGDEERAAFAPRGERSGESEAERIAREHGFGPDRLIALRGLARSRGVPLEDVLHAALRGDLTDVVLLPPLERDAQR